MLLTTFCLDSENKSSGQILDDSQTQVYCTGFCVLGANSMVFLSDGRTAYSAYGDVQMIRAERVEVFGSWFPVWNTAQIVKQHPEMVYHPMTAFDVVPVQPQESYPAPVVFPRPPATRTRLAMHGFMVMTR